MKAKQKRSPSMGIFLTYLLLIIATLYSFWPIMIVALEGYGIDLAALFSGNSVGIIDGVKVYGGFYPTPIHYLDSLFVNGFPRLSMNTSVIAMITVGIALAVGATSAYALARVPIRGKGVISYVLLALRAVSPFVVVVPLYVFSARVGLWDTNFGARIAAEVLVLSVVGWMRHGFFSDIPHEIYDAAAISGASEWEIFTRVALRMVIPGVVVPLLW